MRRLLEGAGVVGAFFSSLLGGVLRERLVRQRLDVAGALDAHLRQRRLDPRRGAELLEPRAREEVVLVRVVGLARVHHGLEVVVHVLGHRRGPVPPGRSASAASGPRRRVRKLVFQALQDPVVLLVVVRTVSVVSVVLVVRVVAVAVVESPSRLDGWSRQPTRVALGGAVPPGRVAPAAVLHQPPDLPLGGAHVPPLHLHDAQVLAHAQVRAGALLDLAHLLASLADDAALLSGALDRDERPPG